MKISARADYACRSLFELALHWPSETPLQVGEIAIRQKIPIKFLIHILISLKQLGLVKSVRGKKGGYVLAKPPAEIKLNDLMGSFSGESAANGQSTASIPSTNIMAVIWQEVDTAVTKITKSISFEDICNRAHAKGKTFQYDI